MKIFNVSWTILVSCDTPEEAALIAKEVQLDENSGATVFNVNEEDNIKETYTIDLAEIKPKNTTFH